MIVAGLTVVREPGVREARTGEIVDEHLAPAREVPPWRRDTRWIRHDRSAPHAATVGGDAQNDQCGDADHRDRGKAARPVECTSPFCGAAHRHVQIGGPTHRDPATGGSPRPPRALGIEAAATADEPAQETRPRPDIAQVMGIVRL